MHAWRRRQQQQPAQRLKQAACCLRSHAAHARRARRRAHLAAAAHAAVPAQVLALAAVLCIHVARHILRLRLARRSLAQQQHERRRWRRRQQCGAGRVSGTSARAVQRLRARRRGQLAVLLKGARTITQHALQRQRGLQHTACCALARRTACSRMLAGKTHTTPRRNTYTARSRRRAHACRRLLRTARCALERRMTCCQMLRSSSMRTGLMRKSHAPCVTPRITVVCSPLDDITGAACGVRRTAAAAGHGVGGSALVVVVVCVCCCCDAAHAAAAAMLPAAAATGAVPASASAAAAAPSPAAAPAASPADTALSLPCCCLRCRNSLMTGRSSSRPIASSSLKPSMSGHGTTGGVAAAAAAATLWDRGGASAC